MRQRHCLLLSAARRSFVRCFTHSLVALCRCSPPVRRFSFFIIYPVPAAKFLQTYFAAAAARCSLSIILAGINFFYLTDAK
jgi:hypothetical protein